MYIHEHIYRHIFKKIKKHFKRQANIWSINEIIRGFVVFYEKDSEITRNAKSEISDEINKLFKDELAKIDYLKLYGEKYFYTIHMRT